MTMTQRQESLIRSKPGHNIHLALKKLEMTFSRRPHTLENNTQVLGEQRHGNNEATQRCQPKNTNSMRDTTTHMVFEGEPAVKHIAKNIEVGTSANSNPRQDQVSMGRVHSPGSTNH